MKLSNTIRASDTSLTASTSDAGGMLEHAATTQTTKAQTIMRPMNSSRLNQTFEVFTSALP
jgi:hypothetical protein